jgi:hypothetical protein
MRYRNAVAVMALALMVAGVSLLPACGPPSLNAPSSALARTAWGDPDLQGVWRYEGAIPLERPAQLEGRDSLTAQEVAEREKLEKEQAAKRLAGLEGAAVGRRSVAESPIRGNEYNSFWQDHGRPRQISNRTSLVVDPPDGRIPYTADARKAESRSAARYGVGPFESYLDPDTGERCLTDGVTGMMWQGPNGGHNRIVQSPGYVTILHEEYRDRRVIPVALASDVERGRQPASASAEATAGPRRSASREGGRQHGTIRQWFGDAIGRWEGDTLVVDTTNFLDRTNYEWASIWTRPSESLHLVERFKRIDATTLEYTITVEDPTTFTSPWTAMIPISKLSDDTQIYEYACHEGNYAMPNLLRGGRTDAARTSSR